MLRPLWMPWFLKQGKEMQEVKGTVENVRDEIKAWIADQEKWLVEGLPHRDPITPLEVQRRIYILSAALELMG